MKYILFAISCFVFSQSLSAQSRVAKEFEEQSDGYKVFAYQSVLRLLNQNKDPEFNLLIRDLDHIRVVTTDSVGVQAKQVFDRLDNGVREEGFEEILTFDNKDYKCHVYELAPGKKKSTWVATFFMEGRAGIFEMVGSLDVRYLSAFSSLNMERLKDMMPGEFAESAENWD